MSDDNSFLDDLEKAKALSLETLELERLRRERRIFGDGNDRRFKENVTAATKSSFVGRPKPKQIAKVPNAFELTSRVNDEQEKIDLIDFSPVTKQNKNDMMDILGLDFFESTPQVSSITPPTISTFPALSLPVKSSSAPWISANNSVPSRHSPLTTFPQISPLMIVPQYTPMTTIPQNSLLKPLTSSMSLDYNAFSTSLVARDSSVPSIIKKRNTNLIDFTNDNTDGEDLLSVFDPLMKKAEETEPQVNNEKPLNTFEDDFDPTIMLPSDDPPALPPRCPLPPKDIDVDVDVDIDSEVPLRSKKSPPCPRSYRLGHFVDNYLIKPLRWRRKKGVYENIRVIRRHSDAECSEDDAFVRMVNELRSEFSHDDYHTNVGLVLSPILESQREESMSVKLLITSSYTEKPILFTCDVTTTIEHVISHVVCTVFDDESNELPLDEFVLKVHGLAEYFSSDSSLIDYEYVHRCQKYDEDVRLTLLHTSNVKRPLARTVHDDNHDCEMTSDDLLGPSGRLQVTRETLTILVEIFEKEVTKMREQSLQVSCKGVNCQGVIQSVKAICAILSQIEPINLTEAVEYLELVATHYGGSCHITSLSDDDENGSGPFAVVEFTKSEPSSKASLLDDALERLNIEIRMLLDVFCRSFRVDFDVDSSLRPQTSGVRDISSLTESILFNVTSIHRLPTSWSSFEQFVVVADLYHGSNLVEGKIESKAVAISSKFYERLIFNQWLQFDLMICAVPRESRFVFSVYGLKPLSSADGTQLTRTFLGWTSLHLFDFNCFLNQGSFLRGLWSEEFDRETLPATQNLDVNCAILEINLPDFGCRINFPNVSSSESSRRRNFSNLDSLTQQQLLYLIHRPTWLKCSEEESELIWDRRHSLFHIPEALPRVMLAAHAWNLGSLTDIYSMLNEWTPMNPIDALGLLLPCFPDVYVRKIAINWIKQLGSDELCDFLPQLVQAVKHDTWINCAISKFLLERSLTSIRVAHHLYWLLKWNCDDVYSGNRMKTLLSALLFICGRAMRERFESQEQLMVDLSEVAERIKSIKDSLRLPTLLHELETVHYSLESNTTSLPLSPSVEVIGLEVKACSYFTSNTVPLKLSFRSSEIGSPSIDAIFKVGDDLRQDLLTLQLIRIMDKLWLKDGLDLRVVTFTCVATGNKKGIVEMVPASETLRKIQVEHGLTGSFKDRPIAEWLQKHNPSELEYQLAVDNFTLSCVAYSVATYVLGICDRHNDNIMLKSTGHIFHIDFGKFLGDSQMFGSIKRDRVPFVLTSDMVYVINGGDKPSSRFHQFVELCCQAFNIIRKNANLFLNMFSLMASAGITGVTSDSVSYVYKALLPDISDVEASVTFSRMIEDSLKSRFTQFNFFIHNLAQLRFTGDHDDSSLLSFIPKTYSMDTDGKIRRVEVFGCQKRYEPEKCYLYILLVEREGDCNPSFLFRSYREFWEFHQKLTLQFPLAKCHALTRSTYLGRSHVRQVAEKRKLEIDLFLHSLWTMADEIKHCALVYTFFHPLLRDQQETNCHLLKLKEPKRVRPRSDEIIRGEIKLSIRYRANSLFIMVMHARNLTSTKSMGPDAYVKSYLMPDQNKITKKKTKVMRKNNNPTFMEMLQYRLPLEIVRQKTLQISVWDYDLMVENAFLGGCRQNLSEIDLMKENISWYPLGHLPR